VVHRHVKKVSGEGNSGMSEISRFPPHGATRPGSAEREPSEIPSRTRSVSAFLLSRASTGPRSSGDVAPSSDIPLKQSGKAGQKPKAHRIATRSY